MDLKRTSTLEDLSPEMSEQDFQKSLKVQEKRLKSIAKKYEGVIKNLKTFYLPRKLAHLAREQSVTYLNDVVRGRESAAQTEASRVGLFMPLEFPKYDFSSLRTPEGELEILQATAFYLGLIETSLSAELEIAFSNLKTKAKAEALDFFKKNLDTVETFLAQANQIDFENPDELP